ncbi:uncharacterized protein EURHEDRAFT_380611 [Aspergillus ruber CBS 135680]|uniref:Uncharacterized protein n=1 Tax=Aspergillus ruber (strain CBS 135680) TaxID=1388766 RepID=A0A017S522_ASPRC|nr:uncharacterized protein EURHEDRAFT_380611 [Aspergillus ruber CBS 135680]EYE91946.1 hypothetical protein EURHEDRAFT_380611 [Aspergillus ruber CBS 135680]
MNEERYPGDYHAQDDPSIYWQYPKNNTFTTYQELVVRPYAVEEPHDDAEDHIWETTEPIPQWQRELVESLDELACESDTSAPSLRSSPTRGQKRKSASTSSQDCYPDQSPSSDPDLRSDDSEPETTNMSPKRRRRKCQSNQFRANLDAADAAFLPHHSHGLSMSPNSESQFADTSSSNSTSNGAATPDAMDMN